MKIRGIMSLICVLLFPMAVFAQDTVVKPRPKIGLVLSGGGAKGFAHIGVLKVLEKTGVKIDYIGGTSMGAIIGGLYASGYNATQIDSIFRSTNFDELLGDYIPRASKNFYGKRNDELYALTLPFQKMRIGIPRSYSKGIYNYNLIAKLTHNVRHVRDFNKLPIPFLCIATDIETGEEILLNKGYLPQAIRASAALPTVFSPVELDGRLLVDGGVSNNYPIDEVRKLGADIIIGVDVQDDLKDREYLSDATRILSQISNLQMIEKMQQKKKQTEIYIKPDMSDYSVISFSNGAQIIDEGERAAWEQAYKLRAITVQKGEYHRPDIKVQKDSLNIKNINIDKLDNFTRAYIIGKLRFKNGSKICYDDLRAGIDNLTGTQNFSSISYSLEKTATGDELRLHLVENPIRTYLKFGLHYDGLYKSGILMNVTTKRVLFKNDVVSADVILGDNFRYNFDYYVDNGFYFSFGLRSRYNSFNRNVGTDFSNGALLDSLGLNTLNINFSDLSHQAYIQTLFIQKFMIGAGLEWKHLKIKSETIQNQTVSPTFEQSDYLSGLAYLRYDSYDNRYFPKKGSYFSGDFQTYLYSSDYGNDFEKFSILKAEIGFAKTFFRKFTLRYDVEAGSAIGDHSIPFFDFVLGGYGFSGVNNIKQFYGYDFLSISGDSYIKTGLTFDYEIFRKHHVNVAANFANLGSNIYADGSWVSWPHYTGYAVGYGMETIIGPIEIKYSWSPELPKGFTWFSVGFWF
ncbi:patatin-like phospholipase family protein [Flavobacterium sp. MAH-1]|uniref:Patatin-like phospholipase family protein n=2 Tax=Flavobacterium agri TaxID=2743471 RepID=A0A7Y8Y2F6_9FLAO|nr:patatin-like phospholipase family protein [Flavobacterium agri]NYA71318.1 patatin-like phospholipase family protein [Flavobacterium agri]